MTTPAQRSKIEAVVVGGSAGAVNAFSTVLSALPSHFSIPLAVVLHLLPHKPSYLVPVFAAQCGLIVKEAEDKETITIKTLYIAPPNYHLLVEKPGALSLSADAPEHFSRPSIDVLFESAADVFGPRLLGVLLSGANDDGANGLAHIQRQGGLTVVQSPQTATAPVMPEAALRVMKPDHVLGLLDIGPFLASLDRASFETET